MNQTISTQEVKDTKAYQRLEPVFQMMLCKLSNLKAISNGFFVYRTTGVIPGSIQGNTRSVVLELVEIEKSKNT